MGFWTSFPLNQSTSIVVWGNLPFNLLIREKGWRPSPYLAISKPVDVWVQIEVDAFRRILQRYRTDEENRQQDVRECCGEVHNLEIDNKTFKDIVQHCRVLIQKKSWTLMSVNCIMMFRWINEQPGIQKFGNLCSHYQDIYDWISPFNKLSDWWFILTQQSMVENEYGNSSHLSISLLLWST